VKVAPTKSTLLRLRETLSGAEEAKELLEQRREILVAELMRHLHRRREYRRKVSEALAKSTKAAVRVRMVLGDTGLRSLLLAPPKPPSLTIWHESLMGAPVPRVQLHAAEEELIRPLLEAGGLLEDADGELRNLAEVIAPWLEAEGATWSLAAEVARTQRKVAALEKTVIPDLTSTVRRIVEALDELEREDYFRRKRLKAARGRG
jgi:V/A-type H+-transporting ATPase subunit D